MKIYLVIYNLYTYELIRNVHAYNYYSTQPFQINVHFPTCFSTCLLICNTLLFDMLWKVCALNSIKKGTLKAELKNQFYARFHLTCTRHTYYLWKQFSLQRDKTHKWPSTRLTLKSLVCTKLCYVLCDSLISLPSSVLKWSRTTWHILTDFHWRHHHARFCIAAFHFPFALL